MITELDRDQMGFLASRSVALSVLQKTKTTIVQVGPSLSASLSRTRTPRDDWWRAALRLSQDSGSYVLLLLVRRMDAYKSVSSIVCVYVCVFCSESLFCFLTCGLLAESFRAWIFCGLWILIPVFIQRIFPWRIMWEKFLQTSSLFWWLYRWWCRLWLLHGFSFSLEISVSLSPMKVLKQACDSSEFSLNFQWEEIIILNLTFLCD